MSCTPQHGHDHGSCDFMYPSPLKSIFLNKTLGGLSIIFLLLLLLIVGSYWVKPQYTSDGWYILKDSPFKLGNPPPLTVSVPRGEIIVHVFDQAKDIPLSSLTAPPKIESFDVPGFHVHRFSGVTHFRVSIWLALVILGLTMLVLVRRSYSNDARCCCRICGYILTKDNNQRCPECGTSVPSQQWDAVIRLSQDK